MHQNVTESPNRQPPNLDTRSHTDVVIYDGNCTFCCRQIERLGRWDKRGRLSFLSLHAPEVAKRFPDLTHEQLMQQMVIVDRQGRRRAGAAAFRYLTRKLPRLWPLAPLLHIPLSLPIWQWCYRQVAKRRYWLGGSKDCEGDSCKVHVR